MSIVLLDPTSDTAVYNDLWIKRYVSALIQRQWGANLIKFQGAPVGIGITMNGEFIYNEGKEKVQKLEDEMLTVYETMPMDMIGYWQDPLTSHMALGTNSSYCRT